MPRPRTIEVLPSWDRPAFETNTDNSRPHTGQPKTRNSFPVHEARNDSRVIVEQSVQPERQMGRILKIHGSWPPPGYLSRSVHEMKVLYVAEIRHCTGVFGYAFSTGR